MATEKKTTTPAALIEREWFLRDVETVVKISDPTVQSLEFYDLGGPDEAVLINCSATQTRVPTASSSLLCIAKSVMEALPY